MRILVTGDRHWTDCRVMERVFRMLPADTVIINGDCRGADRIASDVADQCGFKIERYPADWKTHGNAAGPIRNARMLQEGKPDVVFAFHENIDASRGTKDMVRRALRASVPVTLFSTNGPVQTIRWPRTRRQEG